MTKQYVSKIDNIKFSSKESLIEHILQNYILEDNETNEIGDIHKKLQDEFPFAIIDVRETDSSEKEYGQFRINMRWETVDIKDADFEFYVGDSSDHDYYYTTYKDIESAISHYNHILNIKNEIIEKLNKQYIADSIIVDQIFEGDTSSEDIVSIKMAVNGKLYYGTYVLYKDDIDQFVSSFRGYFDMIIEGEVIKERNYYDGYNRETKINGIPLSRIINRAKRIRIEILESN